MHIREMARLFRHTLPHAAGKPSALPVQVEVVLHEPVARASHLVAGIKQIKETPWYRVHRRNGTHIVPRHFENGAIVLAVGAPVVLGLAYRAYRRQKDAAEKEAIHTLKPEEQYARLRAVKDTIIEDRMRIVYRDGKPAEMWGYVLLNGMPLCFRAKKQKDPRDFTYTYDGKVVRGISYWWPERPQNPANFKPSKDAEPITTSEVEAMLFLLGQTDETIEHAKGTLDGLHKLFVDVLRNIKKDSYRGVFHAFDNDALMRTFYRDGVSMACKEREEQLIQAVVSKEV